MSEKQIKKDKLVSLTIRIWHVIHGISIFILILTGIHLRYPDLFVIFGTVRKAVQIHNIVGIIVTLDYFLWFIYYIVKKEMVLHYVPTIYDFGKGTIRQAQYYFYRIFFGDPPPFLPTQKNKFNSLQKITYAGIMFIFLPIQILTGILLWDIEQFLPVVAIMGGLKIIDAVHVIIGYVFAAFLILHIYLATLGHTVLSHFKLIIFGYEE
ncbi:MAG: cytochrome b/b6 domain-containing protein [Syntrophorhabdaceae bacterium]|nr:cytochrome b/b6 domain-containing protein [Syntrophorhabdaceae bacterium]